MALVLGDLGRLAHLRSEDALARVRYQEALTIAREVGDRSEQADHWLGLGDGMLELDRLEDVADAYAHSLAGLARVHQAQGDLEQARKKNRSWNECDHGLIGGQA